MQNIDFNNSSTINTHTLTAIHSILELHKKSK